MDNTTKAIVIGGGAFIAYHLLRKSIAGGTLIFINDRIYSLRLENATPILTFGLRVQNTSNQRFTINSFAATITSNGYNIGNASFFAPQVIMPNSEVILQVRARLMPLGIVEQLISAFINKDFNFVIDINGFANVDRLQVPVNISYRVGK